MAAARRADSAAGPADPRMLAYFEFRHHPQRALPTRVGFLAMSGHDVIGYIAGHLTTRHNCGGEIQYLYVAPAHRRRGIARDLLHLMADWFNSYAAVRVCVCADIESPSALACYEHLGAAPLFPGKKGWWVWERIDNLLAGPTPVTQP
jgi:ribosomal protein S18 acetylase RimI-like enzyme